MFLELGCPYWARMEGEWAPVYVKGVHITNASETYAFFVFGQEEPQIRRDVVFGEKIEYRQGTSLSEEHLQLDCYYWAFGDTVHRISPYEKPIAYAPNVMHLSKQALRGELVKVVATKQGEDGGRSRSVTRMGHRESMTTQTFTLWREIVRNPHAKLQVYEQEERDVQEQLAQAHDRLYAVEPEVKIPMPFLRPRVWNVVTPSLEGPNDYYVCFAKREIYQWGAQTGSLRLIGYLGPDHTLRAPFGSQVPTVSRTDLVRRWRSDPLSW